MNTRDVLKELKGKSREEQNKWLEENLNSASSPVFSRHTEEETKTLTTQLLAMAAMLQCNPLSFLAACGSAAQEMEKRIDEVLIMSEEEIDKEVSRLKLRVEESLDGGHSAYPREQYMKDLEAAQTTEEVEKVMEKGHQFGYLGVC